MRCSNLAIGSLVIAAMLFFSTASTWAMDILLDDFTNTGTRPPWPITITKANPFVSGTEASVPGILGGSRGYNISDTTRYSSVDMFGPNGSATYRVLTTAGNSVLDYQSTSDGLAGIELDYGGIASFHDLALPFNAGILTVNFSSLAIPDSATFAMTGILDYDTSRFATAMNFKGVVNTIQQIGPTAQRSFAIPLDLGALSSKIDDMSFIVEPPYGAAFQVDSITFTPVPEPSTLTLLALGAVGLAVMRRRR